MTSQKAIFVPAHGVPEAIRSIRFIPKLNPIGAVDPTGTSPSQGLPKLEVWQGDLYGDATKEMPTTFSTSDRPEIAYANGEMPVVSPGKSAMVVVHDAPSGYEVEFHTEFTDRQGNTVKRTVTLDDCGTAHETLCEMKSFARRGSVALHPTGDVHRTGHVVQSLGRLLGRLATSMSSVFRAAPNATQFAEQGTLQGADIGLRRPAVAPLGFAPKSSDDSGK